MISIIEPLNRNLFRGFFGFGFGLVFVFGFGFDFDLVVSRWVVIYCDSFKRVISFVGINSDLHGARFFCSCML